MEEKTIHITANSGLVLEGGGMRGIFTNGVLDYFMDKGICFPYIIGVSAGACNALSYLSNQRGRAKYINTDLIAGLPGDNFRMFSRTMDEIIRLDPENITVHTFCIKKSAEVLRQNSHIYSAKGGDVGKCVDYSQIKTEQAGYIPYYMYRQKNTVGNYENVGFSKPSYEGLYNIYMMEEIHSIFAAGAGAVGKLVDNTGSGSNKREIERMFHQKYPYEYLKEDRNELFAETAVRFYTERGML